MRFYPFVSTGNGASSRGTRRADNARGQFETGRFLFWTEDSRMHAAINEKFYSYYTYDHSGVSCGSREQIQACLSYAEMEQRRRSQRRLKLVGDNCSMDVNAEYMNASSALNEPTLYPSAYMVLTNKGYTKHYYAGTERVAARLGGGGLNAQYHVISNDGVLQTKADMLFGQSLEQVNSRVLNENDLDCIMSNEFAKEEFDHWIDGIPNQMKADVEFDYSKFSGMVNSMLTDYHNGEEEEVYFYHSDHLGSASWITDFEGIAVQHLQYMPYGEPYVNRRISGYSERFTFTGKERDAETGYSYFGARYYDSDLSGLFLSVDPMANKYPGLSPYAYCAWNPVKLVDPDGREINESTDWYKDASGYVHWDANVHSQADLKNSETYIGRTACMVAEGDDIITYGDQYGQTHSSVPLSTVTVSADRPSSNKTQGFAWVDNVSFGVALGNSLISEASGYAYTDYIPLEEAKIAKGFNVTGKIMQTTGRLAGAAGVVYTSYRALSDDGYLSVGEGIRIGLQSAAVATSFIPVYGTAISLGLTAMDFFFGDKIERIGSK